jgi:hypothetical protein
MTLAVTLQRKWPDARHMRDVFSNFGMRVFHYAKNRHDQGGPMSIVAAVVSSILLLTVTGCVTASDPPTAKQETGKKDFSSF